MNEQVRKHLPIMAAVFAIGVLTGAFALLQVRNAVPGLSVDTYNLLTLLIPCAVILICSTITMMLANEIGRPLFSAITITGIVIGAVAMVVTSIWMADPTFASHLAAYSPEGARIIPATDAPLIIARNVAAFFVCAVVGCIAGAWVGSRLHPVRATKYNKGNRR